MGTGSALLLLFTFAYLESNLRALRRRQTGMARGDRVRAARASGSGSRCGCWCPCCWRTNRRCRSRSRAVCSARRRHCPPRWRLSAPDRCPRPQSRGGRWVGNNAVTRKPPSSVGPAENEPPSKSARSRRPTRPWPPLGSVDHGLATPVLRTSTRTSSSSGRRPPRRRRRRVRACGCWSAPPAPSGTPRRTRCAAASRTEPVHLQLHLEPGVGGELGQLVDAWLGGVVALAVRRTDTSGAVRRACGSTTCGSCPRPVCARRRPRPCAAHPPAWRSG